MVSKDLYYKEHGSHQFITERLSLDDCCVAESLRCHKCFAGVTRQEQKVAEIFRSAA